MRGAMQLKHLLHAVHPVSVEGPTDREIVGIGYDSRRITPGMVFVAIPGRRMDGHDYIHNAIDRGATAVICERNGFVPQRATKIKVADGREALALASAAFYEHPSTRLKLIGVTGTNGKTTVAFMVKHLLEMAGVKTGLIGTIRYEVGDRVFPAQRTTPEALEVQQMLAQMIRAGCQACVMEVSSHALAQKRVRGVHFDVGIFTNLTRDHLDYHQTMENYFAAKKILFSTLEAGPKPGGAVINLDDPYGAQLARETKVEVQLTYGVGGSARLRAHGIQLDSQGALMTVEFPGGQFACRVPLIGRHNVYNALAATGAGLLLEIEAPLIQRALETVAPVPGRLENVAPGLPFAVYVDYAHTDDALHNVLTTLREITRGRLLLAFGCGGDRDKGKRPRMGQVAAALADYTLVTSDNPRRESPAQIAAEILEGFAGAGQDRCRVELDRRRAIDDIVRMARGGDTVLIAGKGHETYQEYEDTVVPFDDRVYARESVEALAGGLPSPNHASRH